MTHLVVDMMRFGPSRGYCCFAFEGFNKVVKAAATISNFRAEDVFVIEHWMFKSAKRMQNALHMDWASEYESLECWEAD